MLCYDERREKGEMIMKAKNILFYVIFAMLIAVDQEFIHVYYSFSAAGYFLMDLIIDKDVRKQPFYMYLVQFVVFPVIVKMIMITLFPYISSLFSNI